MVSCPFLFSRPSTQQHFNPLDTRHPPQLRSTPADKAILGVARLVDPSDKYLLLWERAANNPVQFDGEPIAFPGQIWKSSNGLFNFVGQGFRFQTNDSSLHSWKNMGPMVKLGERSGQWWIPIPNQVDGTPPPPTGPNIAVNVGNGADFLLGIYDEAAQTFTPWPVNGTEQINKLEMGSAGWFGAQGGKDNNNRMMLIGWAMGDYPRVTRLTLLREANWDNALGGLVANPVPELVGLRTENLAHETDVALSATPHAVAGTDNGAAAAADVVITFKNFPAVAKFGACVLTNATFFGIGIFIEVNNGTATANSGPCTAGLELLSSSIESPARPFPLLGDAAVTLRILADRSVADFFVQGGRWAGTSTWPPKEAPRGAGDSSVVVWAQEGAGTTADVDVWGMGCGWVDPSYTEHPTM